MIGRDEELRLVDAAVRRGDGPRGVVLAGEAGVGKTRLARECLGVVQARGAQTRWAVGSVSARALPLGAFAGLLGTASEEPSQILRHAAAQLMVNPGRTGVVIGVDDAHLLDDLSALLVQQLVLRANATIVVTVRTGEPAPDVITALWKGGHLDRVELQPLSEAETGTLLESVLGGQLDSTVAARLWALTRGNVLYLRQLVEGELEAGRLHSVRDLWRWKGHLELSPGLAEVIGARMGHLSAPLREVIDLLALGEPLPVTALRELAEPNALEEAEERDLVEVTANGPQLEARLAHPLYGEARRRTLGRVRTRRLHGQIAAALAASNPQSGDITLRRALHVLDSDLGPDPELLTAAAHRALQLLDVAAAERLSRAALSAGAGFEARYTLALALSWLSRGAESETEFATLAGLAATNQQRFMVGVPRAANLFWSGRDPAGAEAVLAELGADDSDEQARRMLTAAQSAFDAFLGRPEMAADKAAEALASPALPPTSIMLATYGYVGGFGMLGRTDQLEPFVSRAYALAGQSFDHAMTVFGLYDLHLMALRLAGYVTEAESIAAASYLHAREIPGLAVWLGTTLRGYAAAFQGRVQSASRLLRSAHSELVPIDQQGHGFRCQLHLTLALGMAGDVAHARKALEDLDAAWHPAFVFAEPDVVLARAWVSAAEGAISEAVRLAHEAADLAAERGQIAHEMYALHTAVRFGDRSIADRLAALAVRIDGPRAPAAARHAAALATDDGQALLSVAASFEEMGDLLAAADAAAQAAAVHALHDRRADARAAGARAHLLAEACEGARTPALAAIAAPLPLTDREREIACLAARGLSNRQIADRLVVSVRTVEGHLYRASTKLGVSERTELAALLGIR